MIAALGPSLVLLAGRRFWLAPLLPLPWLGLQAVALLIGARETFEPDAAQNTLIGAPIAVLAVFLGGRVITGELDQRGLEIAYTVPGGAHRVWLGKLAAAAGLLTLCVALTAAVAYALFTPFPIVQTLYGTVQGVAFFLAVSMGFATLLRSEVAGALASVGLLALALTVARARFSPFWNPLKLNDTDPERLLALAIQNRIGMALAIAAIVALAFARAERREKMLSG